jgi:molybdopterin molybdotransferase
VISYTEALQIIARAATPLPARRVPAAEAAGGTLGADVHSTVAVPPFDNSAREGFAVRSADTARAGPDRPVALRVAGLRAAGPARPQATATRTAWEITTGAAMPPGCDGVVPVERSRATESPEGGRLVMLEGPVPAGANVRLAGEDFQPGSLVARRGARLTPEMAMALAAVGAGEVEAIPPPRLAVVTTGDELVMDGATDGAPLGPGMIRDVNGPYLQALCRALGLPPATRHHAADDPAAVLAALAAAAGACDVLLTTGGVSAGRLDFLPDALRRLGAEVLFHKVAIRPGKPVLFGRLPRGPLVFGLPGNPIAVAACMRFLVIPALRALQAMPAESWLRARSEDPLDKRSALTFFAKAQARVTGDAGLRVRLLPGQESFRIAPLLQANAWALLPAGLAAAPAGTLLDVAPLLPGPFLQP